MNDTKNAVYETVPVAKTSWVAETAKEEKGFNILDNLPEGDGTSLMLEAFAEAIITNLQPKQIVEEGYYATQLSLLGHEAMVNEKTLVFPDKYKIDYLNHKSI